MKSFFRRNKRGFDSSDPVAMRSELLRAELPAEKIGEIVTGAAAKVQEDPKVLPEVSRYAGEYADILHKQIGEMQHRVGKHALIQTVLVTYAAGRELRQAHGDPTAGDFVHDASGLAGGVNANDARNAVELAMGQVYHDMLHPPEDPR